MAKTLSFALRAALFGSVALCLSACGDSDTRTDAQKLSDFHKDISAQESAMDTAVNSFKSASGTEDRTALYQAADNLSTAMNVVFSEASKITVPDISNVDAAKAAAAMLDALQTEAADRESAADDLKKMADSGDPTPSLMTESQKALGDAQYQSVREASAVLAGYKALGVNIDQVDLENGGIKGKSDQNPG